MVLDPDTAEIVRRRCRAVLDAGWREGVHDGRAYAFTAPSPGRYPWQWYWDSCFHAIVRRRIDPARARRELESLLSVAQDGFIGHVIFFGRPLNLERAIRYNVARRRDLMTRTIQPPLLAWAWRIAVGDPAAEPAIAAHHAWLAEHRDLDGDGLLWLIQPDESGLDASPKFDAVWGPFAQGRRLFPALIHRNRRLGFDARRIRDAGGPVLCEVLTNVMWSLSEQAMGRPSKTPALVDRLWDERAGRFLDEPRGRRRRRGGAAAAAVRTAAAGSAAAGRPGHAVRASRRPAADRAPRPPLTWDTLAPLALPDLPDEIGHRLVRELLLDREHFWSGVPLASVALDDPAHTSRDHYWGLRRYWRGPSWVNAAWLAWLGLRRLGYTAEADDLTARLATVIAREGLREYYDARTGAGMGARDFGWSTLIWEMLEPDPAALGSHLGTPSRGDA